MESNALMKTQQTGLILRGHIWNGIILRSKDWKSLCIKNKQKIMFILDIFRPVS